MSETLSGIPSIIYGLFGMIFSLYFEMGLFTYGRCGNSGNYGTAYNIEYNQRST